ncbi:TetR/AcrR family transcriptional regulator [Microlunatus soli]|uniref:DNA-binding transcriptional regulator, AcrR family n=1 Tax=Microlunatus soli TaxID=630515 RepID=A0A1H1XJ66_9ACTN|nr:TetR/AcrR family transcriptional regulator [Microlunatus soli]SDT09304.1 DNA-binding transcriptional regulator, AcrR family [Microlunatus soli]
MSTTSVARGEAVRQRLLAAAVELIAELGWSAVSTRLLAERAGVTPSVVHYHYSSMRALLNEAVLEMIGRGVAELDRLLATAHTPAEVIDAIFAAADRYTGRDDSTLVAVESTLAGTRDQQLRADLRAALDGFRIRFGDWLAEHRVSDPHETAAVVAASLDGLVLQRALGVELPRPATAAVLRRLVATTEQEDR